MTAPFGQPEPFEPTMMAPVVDRRSTRKRPYLPAVLGVALAIAAFGAGFGVANAVAPGTPTTNGFTGDGGNGFGNFGPGASGRPRFGNGGDGAGFGGGASGTIGSISSDQMTITTSAGSQRIVLLTPTTTVTKVTSTTQAITDLTTGETVTVVGTSNPDGSVTATEVVIGNVTLFGRGAFGGPEGSPAP